MPLFSSLTALPILACFVALNMRMALYSIWTLNLLFLSRVLLGTFHSSSPALSSPCLRFLLMGSFFQEAFSGSIVYITASCSPSLLVVLFFCFSENISQFVNLYLLYNNVFDIYLLSQSCKLHISKDIFFSPSVTILVHLAQCVLYGRSSISISLKMKCYQNLFLFLSNKSLLSLVCLEGKNKACLYRDIRI